MKTRIKQFIIANKLIFLAFAIPVVLVMIALAITGVFPFGSNQVLVIDMYHQYLPFLSELQDKMQHGDSLFYTWNGAAGSNFWNLIAYYGASPLNLLLLLFPTKLIVEAVTIILLVKLGLASAFMCIYLRSVNKRCDFGTVAFATLYALCAFVMGYYWCIMWMDAVLLLPLVILGLNKIIKGGSPLLYCVTLGLTVFANYYISIMVCLFVMFYYPVCYFLNTKGAGARICVFTTIKAVAYSLLSIGMSAVMLLPTYYSMQSTYYIDSQMPEGWIFYNSPMEILNQLLPFAQLTYRDGLPNLYCGLIVVMLIIFYVTNKTIRLRTKALNIGFLVFMFLSLNINKLDFVWSGFHFPNQLPYRYSFVISFILVGMAYQAFLRIDSVTTNTIWAAMAGILGWYVIAQRFLTDRIDQVDVFFYLGVALLVAYTIVLVCYKKGYLKREYLATAIAIVIVIEMGFNVTLNFQKVGNSDREYYFDNYDNVTSLVEQIDDELARVELGDSFILNTPALYHYKGVSQFSSSINANATYVMEQIGIEGEPGKNRFNYNQTNPVTNAILNVKYLIGKGEKIKDPDFKQISRKGESRLYENQYPLALGYMTSNSIWSWDVDLDNPFSVLDDYIRAATDNEYVGVFRDVDKQDIWGDNVEVYDNGYGAWTAESQNNGGAGSVQITYTADETQKCYVFVEANNCESINVDRGEVGETIDIRSDCGSVVNIGKVSKGETFSIVINYEDGNGGEIVAHVATLDYDLWDAAYARIASNTMRIDSWDDRSLKGTINAREDGAFVTSIPYEKGWHMSVDGEKREIDQLVGGEFIGTGLNAGKHVIELKFRPPGLIAGAIISVLSILILIVVVLWRRKHSKTNASFIQRTGALRINDSSTQQLAYPEPEESDLEEFDCNKEGIDYPPQGELEGCRD